jgi:hypothetical protein
LARPGGNLTGINFFIAELATKRLEFLRELVPAISQVAVLVTPAEPVNADSTLNGVQAAAGALGLKIQVVQASTSTEIEAVFAMFARQRPDALYVGGDSFLNSRRLQLALLAARHAVPASYGSRDYPESGGLMSYGTNVTDAFRQLGNYAGRILKGAKPEDLPVVQASKFELVINIQTARVLGLTVPPSLPALADEVIESIQSHFYSSPGSFKCFQMADYLSAVAPASTIARSLLGESGYALARFRAFLKHARKPASHDRQSPQHGVWPTCGPNAQRISLTIFQEC